MTARWVKKRDGRIEQFEESRIVRAVLRAGRRTGKPAEVEALGREIARSVALYVSKSGARAPETSLVAQAMEAALEETGHEVVARAARDWRDWRRRRGAEVRVREAPPADAPPPSPVEVLSRGGARPWTKQRIVQALTQEADLERESAEDVARAVEERVFAAGLNRITTTLLRELIDGELFERGFSAHLRRLEVVGVPKPDLERMAFLGQGRAPRTLEDRVLRTALERFALDEIVSGKGATAHRHGDVHLIGLGRPYRMASGALSAPELCAAAPGVEGPLDAVGRLVRASRTAAAAYELGFGLVGVDEVLAGLSEDTGELRSALRVLVDALAAPRPDEVPPAPEIVLPVPLRPEEAERQRVVALLVEVLAERGSDAVGLRLLAHLPRPDPAAEPLAAELVRAAGRGAGCDLLLGRGEPPAARATRPRVATVQVALVNLAGLALAAGRGERERFSRRLDDAVQAALDACHKRHRQVFKTFARPASPLFGGDARRGPPGVLDPEVLVDSVGVVGLDAALRYLTGESPTENPRVADLAREVLGELQASCDAAASRLGLGRVRVEEAPEGDAGIRLAALDLERFADARELLGDAPGWDTGARLSTDPNDPLADLRVRLWLARQQGAPLFLGRPALAACQDAPALAAGALQLLRGRGTGRSARGAG